MARERIEIDAVGGHRHPEVAAQPFDHPESGHRLLDVGEGQVRGTGEEAAGGFHREPHVGVDREIDLGADRLVHRLRHPDLAGRRVEADLELEHPGTGRLDPLGRDAGHDAGDFRVGPALGRIHRVGVGHERRPLPRRAAQQLVERLTRVPAGNVPERDLDAGERVPIGEQLGVAVVEGLGRQARIAYRAVIRHREPHHGSREPLVDDARAERAPRLAEAGYPGVRLHFDDSDGDMRDHALRVGCDPSHRDFNGGRANGCDFHGLASTVLCP